MFFALGLACHGLEARQRVIEVGTAKFQFDGRVLQCDDGPETPDPLVQTVNRLGQVVAARR